MEAIRAVKGMNDLFEHDLTTWRWLEGTVRELFLRFGYGEIRTPHLEETRLFARGVGETTDVVEKEMYSFLDRDKKQTSLCLRPENTASVVRALIQHNKLSPDQDTKVFYMGPMFRRERPQKGRYRQFHQLGVEAFGMSHPSIDVEMMAMLNAMLTSLGLKNVRLAINTLGDPEDRTTYTEALRAYYEGHQDALCPDCVRRLEKNPLRILDCKVPGCVVLKPNAPVIMDYLSSDAQDHFSKVKQGLEHLGIPFSVEPRLVRGLDYYTRTVFEAIAETGLGSQNAVAAGGRYDGLVHQLGGRATPAIGFAAGLERLIILLQEENRRLSQHQPDLMLIGLDPSSRLECQRLAHQLRSMGLSVDIDHFERSLRAQMRRADRVNCTYVIVVGADEIHNRKVSLKKMADGESESVALDPDAIFSLINK